MNQTHRLLALIAGLVFVAAFAGGCTPIERPEVFVTNIVPLESTLFEQRVQIDLRIQNPNLFDLPVRGMDVKLDVNGVRMARGVSNDAFVIPSLGEAETSVTTSTSTFDLLRQALVMATLPDEEIPYRIAGRAHLGRSPSSAFKGWPGSVAFGRSDILRLPEGFRSGGGLAPGFAQPGIRPPGITPPGITPPGVIAEPPTRPPGDG